MAPRTAFDTVDAYMAALPDDARAVLERARAAIRKALPDAVEVISYQIPTYKVEGRLVLCLAGFASHWAVYPASGPLRDVLGRELTDRLRGKATIRFSYDERVPVRLLSRIARLRAEHVAASSGRSPHGNTQLRSTVRTRASGARNTV